MTYTGFRKNLQTPQKVSLQKFEQTAANVAGDKDHRRISRLCEAAGVTPKKCNDRNYQSHVKTRASQLTFRSNLIDTPTFSVNNLKGKTKEEFIDWYLEKNGDPNVNTRKLHLEVLADIAVEYADVEFGPYSLKKRVLAYNPFHPLKKSRTTTSPVAHAAISFPNSTAATPGQG